MVSARSYPTYSEGRPATTLRAFSLRDAASDACCTSVICPADPRRDPEGGASRARRGARNAPLSWLREYVRVDATAHEIARRLNVSALEVDRVIDIGVADVGDNLSYLRVGKVVEAAKHPNADKLQLCQLDVGEGDLRQIVCGAWNFGRRRHRRGRPCPACSCPDSPRRSTSARCAVSCPAG